MSSVITEIFFVASAGSGLLGLGHGDLDCLDVPARLIGSRHDLACAGNDGHGGASTERTQSQLLGVETTVVAARGRRDVADYGVITVGDLLLVLLPVTLLTVTLGMGFLPICEKPA